MISCAADRFPRPCCRRLLAWGAVCAAACLSPPQAFADDWPTYRHDVARSGVTDENLQAPLVPCWSFEPRYKPAPAWGDPKPEPVEGILELRRNHFDDVFQPVVAGGAVLFGSSGDGKLYCLDLQTGRIRWTALSGGPIRLAPCVDEGRVYFGSDDGWARCLNLEDGSRVWEFRAAPEDRRVLGHGRMISLWPIRTGVLVDDGIAYFGAGIFPAEGVFLYAVDAASGKEIWRNDTCGEAPQSRISPQGYLLASSTRLYAPMGRVSPAAFDRADGSLEMLTFFGKQVGGTYALLAGDHIYTGTEGMIAYHKDTRDRFAVFEGRKMVVAEATAFLAGEGELKALDRQAYPTAARRRDAARSRHTAVAETLARLKRHPLPDAGEMTEAARALRDAKAELEEARRRLAAATRWAAPCRCEDALVLADDLLVAGGNGEVVAFDGKTGERTWRASVQGASKGLAVASGRLVVSTDAGMIYCFGPKGSPRHGDRKQMAAAFQQRSPEDARFREAAEAILDLSGVRRGFCLVLGTETGRLAEQLARKTELTVCAVSPDAKKVAAARRRLDAAGLLGGRVTVEQWPLAEVPYSDYFANLVVSESAFNGDLPPAAEAFRMLKPEGGVLLIGAPAADGGKHAPDRRALKDWLKAGELPGGQLVEQSGLWARLVRGALPGAGAWTHQYANPGNTTCGDDRRVKYPLGVLWFGSPGPGRMVNRHQRAAGPLAIDGRLFVQGENTLIAHDAYNGLFLWRREIPGAMRVNASHDGSNLAAASEGLFLAVGERCLCLDPATGATRREYSMPALDGEGGRWGYVAVEEGRLYGSRATGLGTSDAVFALEVASGDTLWTYQSPDTIQHSALAIAEGKLFVIDATVTPQERKRALQEEQQRVAKTPRADRARVEEVLARGDVRAVVARDARSGKQLWRRATVAPLFAGGTLSAMSHDGVLVLFGVYLDGHYWRQFFAGEFGPRSVKALATDDGRVLWSRPVGYRVRPVIVGDTLHTEPWAFDLKTGEPRTRIHPVTGQPDRWQFARPGHHCGCPAGSANCLFFRSYCLGFYDLVGDQGTMHFGAQRPGCWINFIPACGLLLFPEASAGCMCPFPNMCSVAFQPVERNKTFGLYSAPGPMTPVKRLALNLGGPGDRNDAEGGLWLGMPRPGGSLVLQFPCEVTFSPGGGYVQRNSAYTEVENTADPWLYASAARGPSRCVVPLLSPGDGKALYTVRLHVADLEQDAGAGRRVCDVKLQGKTVAEDLDPVAEAGGPRRALVKEFRGIEVEDRLTVQLHPKHDTADRLPLICALEIVRERVTSLGCVVPDLEVNVVEPAKKGSVRLANLRSEPFEGVLKLSVPEGLTVTPASSPIKLAAGQRAEIAFEAGVEESKPAGMYALTARMEGPGGKLDTQATATIEHLGRRGRAVLKPVEDAYVIQRYPDQNKAKADVLLVDGGSRKMGDSDHAVAYLKFRIDVPGRPVRATLRLRNAGNPSGDAGRVCLVTNPWSEKAITYARRPAVGKEVARLGRLAENEVVKCPLELDLKPKADVTLAIDPTSCDGVTYVSREGATPPELVVEYVR